MSIDETIQQRRSIRRYTDDPVSPKALREMLSLAALAPNVANRQVWRFVVVERPELRKMLSQLVEIRLNEMANWPEFKDQQMRLRAWREQAMHFAGAPAIIFVINLGYRTPLDPMLVEHGMKFYETNALFGYPDIQSIGAMLGYLTLLAQERGYGTCWLTAPLVAKFSLQSALELKSGEEIVAMMTIGTPAEAPIPRPRRQIDEVTTWL